MTPDIGEFLKLLVITLGPLTSKCSVLVICRKLGRLQEDETGEEVRAPCVENNDIKRQQTYYYHCRRRH